MYSMGETGAVCVDESVLFNLISRSGISPHAHGPDPCGDDQKQEGDERRQILPNRNLFGGLTDEKADGLL